MRWSGAVRGHSRSLEIAPFDRVHPSTRNKREVDDVRDCRDKNRCTFIEKPSGDRIRIRLLVRTVRQNLQDFKFRSRCEREESKKASVVMM